jgi:hypothetical protein
LHKSTRFWLIIVLEIIALGIGAYTYAALHHHERLHVLLLTGLLCLLAGVIGTIVTHAKTHVLSFAILVLGVIALGIGLYFLAVLGYHERGYLTLGVGILGLLGGFAGMVMHRPIAALCGMLVFGIVALSIGLYLKTILDYHGRAYMVLGAGTFCLIGSLAGMIVTQYRARTGG